MRHPPGCANHRIDQRPAGNALGDKPYESGEEYTIDKSAPSVLSITGLDPNPTNEAFVRFEVTFLEEVSGVDADDFVLTTGSYLTACT